MRGRHCERGGEGGKLDSSSHCVWAQTHLLCLAHNDGVKQARVRLTERRQVDVLAQLRLLAPHLVEAALNLRSHALLRGRDQTTEAHLLAELGVESRVHVG